jgi:hypothetical protein
MTQARADQDYFERLPAERVEAGKRKRSEGGRRRQGPLKRALKKLVPKKSAKGGRKKARD